MEKIEIKISHKNEGRTQKVEESRIHSKRFPETVFGPSNPYKYLEAINSIAD